MGTEVVVTGVGVVSAAGVGFDALAEALRTGRGCASMANSPLPVRCVATVPEMVCEHPGFPDDRKAWLAFAALKEALSHANCVGSLANNRTAVFLGTGLSSVTASELEEDAYRHLRDDGKGFNADAMLADLDWNRASPRRHDPARVTSEFVRLLGSSGPTGTSFSACAASAQAIAEGLWSIRRGEVDVAIVGGHDSMVHPFGMLSFVVLGALSPGLCRPFDKARDGFVIGEGAAVLVLERADLAAARGARVLAHLLGAGTSADAHGATAPHPEGAGAQRAMERALHDAGCTSGEVGYVNAHGTGTPLGDLAEAKAIDRVFGPIPVSSIKGTIGHTIAAAGALEAAACIAGLTQGWLPGTFGLERADPACGLDLLMAPKEVQVEKMLSNSFGFGGQNASLLWGRAPIGIE
jgi:3-oxoacyl-[acyl-carrier-protein] synthase II